MDDTKRDGRRRRETASGRFVLRIDPALHARLREDAGEAGVSLNDYCSRKLAAPASAVTGPAVDVIVRADELFRRDLVGVVAFGSWARDELSATSDVDLLVVLRPSVPITRELYRKWDVDPPLRWESRPIEVHLVHLPEEEARVTGLWAEAALDGVVLFDREFAVSHRLVQIRRRIQANELVRRVVHGQPYWVSVA
jgi:predicted nucleotidyltransferase